MGTLAPPVVGWDGGLQPALAPEPHVAGPPRARRKGARQKFAGPVRVHRPSAR